MQITPNSLTIAQLLGSGNEQYAIPAYQRRYSWKEKQIGELWDDIEMINGADTHLLGSIVCLTGHHVAGVNQLELVDGQQRLTTLCILLMCIRDRLVAEGETDEAANVSRFLEAKALGQPPVRKIALDSLDATEFDKLVSNAEIGVPQNPNLCAAFDALREWVSEKSLADLGTFLYRLTNQAIVIRLDVSNAKDAFKLFETINNRGLRLSPTDIIKNFILGNAARFGSDALELARNEWAKLTQHLDGVSSEAFFRQFLCARLQKRITVSYVIPEFKFLFMRQVSESEMLPDQPWYLEDGDIDEGEEEEPLSDDESTNSAAVDGADRPATDKIPFSEFLTGLVNSAKVFGEVVKGETGNPDFDRYLRNLRMINATQTYGYLMHLRVGGCSNANFLKVLKMTEAFMLRRHICKARSNENETAFARLCGVDCNQPLNETREVLREYCPTDERFREDFASTSFKANQIERACLPREV